MVLMVLLVVPFNQSWNQFAYSHQKDATLTATYASTLRYYTLAMTTLIVCFSFVIHELLLIATTPAFAAAYIVVPLLCLSPLAQGYVNFLGTGLHLANKTAIIPFIWIIAMGVNIGLNYLLIPHFGMMGAAIATGVAVITNALLYLIASKRFFPVAYPLGSSLWVLLSGAACLTVYILFDPDRWLYSIGLRLGCLLCFFGLILGSGALRIAEVRSGYKVLENAVKRFIGKEPSGA
jgi:O-antigen/teichoic acid export membrane protein